MFNPDLTPPLPWFSETHSDAQSLEDVHLAHGTGAMIQQPRIHAALMEQMSADSESTVGSVTLQLLPLGQVAKVRTESERVRGIL